MIFLQFIMIFQIFSQIKPIKENTFAPRPLNFYENKFQQKGPSRHYSHESQTLHLAPALVSIVARGPLPSLLHGTEQGTAWGRPALASRGRQRWGMAGECQGVARTHGWPRPGLWPIVATWPCASAAATVTS